MEKKKKVKFKELENWDDSKVSKEEKIVVIVFSIILILTLNMTYAFAGMLIIFPLMALFKFIIKKFAKHNI